MKNKIQTLKAPKAIGPYSQAIKAGEIIYCSGQIPLVPETMLLIGEDIVEQTQQVFKNLQEVCRAAGGEIDQIVKMTIFLTDLSHFSKVNEVMLQFFKEPYPARSTIEVSKLPKDALIEIEAILVVGNREDAQVKMF